LRSVNSSCIIISRSVNSISRGGIRLLRLIMGLWRGIIVGIIITVYLMGEIIVVIILLQ